MRKFFVFLSGAMLGGLVGATVALLLAPSSGEDARLAMRGRYQKIQDEVRHAAAARRAELEQQLAELRKPRLPEEQG